MMKLSRNTIAALAMSCVMLWAAPGLAKDDETVAAGETFRAATEAFNRGDFEAAARSFEVSHRLAPHPNTIYNAGRAWQEAGKLARAADALSAALAMDAISDTQRDDAQSRLAAIRPKLAIAHVIAPEGTRFTLAHAQERPTPASIHLVPGRYTLTAKLPDGRAMERPIDASSAGAEVEIDLNPAGAPSPAPPGSPAAPATPSAPPADEPLTVRNEAQWVTGWVMVAAGVVSGGAAIGLGVAALQARDDFEASGNTDRDARDEAATLRTTTNVLWAAAGALSLTGVLLLVFSDEEAPEGAAPQAFVVSGGIGGLTVSGRW